MFPQCLMESSSEGKEKGENNEQSSQLEKNGMETTVPITLESAKLDTALGSKLLPQNKT